MSVDTIDTAAALPPAPAEGSVPHLVEKSRSGIVGLVRAIPIRWRILSIAALNSAVVLVLAGLIWSGAAVLRSAWEDVRQVRESDKILAVLESETSRLQNLIHRYINQPSPEQFAEILLLREAVLSTLSTRASTATSPWACSAAAATATPASAPTPRWARRWIAWCVTAAPPSCRKRRKSTAANTC